MMDPVPDFETRCFVSYGAGAVDQYCCPYATFVWRSQMGVLTPAPQGNFEKSAAYRCWGQSGGFSMTPLDLWQLSFV